MTRRLQSPAVAKTCSAVAIIFGLAAAAATAQAAEVSAEAEPKTVEVGDFLNFSVSAKSEGNQQIHVRSRPDFGQAFQVVGTSKAPSYMIRNGKAQRSLTHTYRLRALQEGKHTLEPPPVHVAGKEHRAKPVTVKVVAAGNSARRAPSRRGKQRTSDRKDSLFVEHVLEPTRTPYVGEQLTLSYFLYSEAFGRRVQPRPPDEPSLDDFWIEDLSQQTSGKRQTVRVGGRTMERANLRSYALFPLGAGEVTIEPFAVDVVVGGMFQSGRKTRLTADPIEIDVQPLPADAPDSFYEGNVGQWEFRVTADRERAPMGRAITIRVEAEGTGQVGRISLPTLPEIDGARIVGSNESTDRDIKAGVVGGTKTTKYTVVAEREGTLRIPGLAFSYFDSDAEQYRTHTSEPIDIEVRGGEVALKRQAPPDAGRSDQAGEADLLETLVGRLAAPTSEINITGPKPPLSERRLFWLLAAAAALGTLLVWLATPFGALWERFRPGIQRGASYKEALSLLDEPAQTPGVERLDRIRRALSTYMTQVAGVPAGSVTEADLPEHLNGRGLNGELVDRVVQLLRGLDEARYSPDKQARQAVAEELRGECRECLERLEAQRRRKQWRAKSAAAVVLACVAASALTAAAGVAHAQQAPDERVDRAIEAQAEQRWDEAATLWEEVAEDHPEAADVLYNLGTSLAHTADLGGARAALERASTLAPGDADIEANRDIVEQLVRLRQVEEARGTSHDNTTTEGIFWWRLATGVSDDFLPLGLLIALWLLFVASLLRRFSSREGLQSAALAVLVISAIVTVAVAGAWYGRARVLEQVQPAVVINEQIELRQGPSDHAGIEDVRASIVPGVLLSIVDERPGWVELGFADGASAWTRRENVETVRHPR
jgi:tetratricopeptide (TPR) repeat protein